MQSTWLAWSNAWWRLGRAARCSVTRWATPLATWNHVGYNGDVAASWNFLYFHNLSEAPGVVLEAAQPRAGGEGGGEYRVG